MSKKLRHRGPDWSGVYQDDNAILAHQRLAIVDPISGKQPLMSLDKKIVLAVNGEIYNHLELRQKYNDYKYTTESDCEVILPLYQEKEVGFLEDLNGMFAFVIYNASSNEFLIARDHVGIIPLYMGWDREGVFYVASELKALEPYCNKIEIFPPGHYWSSADKEPIRWYKRDWKSYTNVQDNTTDANLLRDALLAAVKDN